ncbi:MAG: DUF2313 domain-containing protein [Thermodesulfovibrionales bacterium]|nr:DUF2313 domain-containing protein [Thermodesulfovibrionales bacterium]
MFHKDVLRLLFPLELGGVFDADLELEGKHLDDAEGRAGDLLNETFPDEALELMPDWERVYELSPGETLQERRDRLVAKIKELGGLSREYFIAIAAALGYTIEIIEYGPFRAGVGRAGDPVGDGNQWIWKVKGVSQNTYYFRAGQSTCGERLGGALAGLEAVLDELKPAHTAINYEL